MQQHKDIIKPGQIFLGIPKGAKGPFNRVHPKGPRPSVRQLVQNVMTYLYNAVYIIVPVYRQLLAGDQDSSASGRVHSAINWLDASGHCVP